MINKDWLKLYKENFLYEYIISKIEDEFKTFSYKKIIAELNDIIKDKIGQIKLYNTSEIEPGLKEASKLLPKIKTIKEKKDFNININKDINMETKTKIIEQVLANSYDIPYEFEIINADIYELLKKEEFFENFSEEIENQLCYQILFGNNQIIIKNKESKNVGTKNNNPNELLFYSKKDEKENYNDNYILEFALSFEKKVNFYEEIGKIGTNLEKTFTENYKLDENLFNVNINLEEKLSKISNDLNNNKGLLNEKLKEINDLKIQLQNKENTILLLNNQISNKNVELNNLQNKINKNNGKLSNIMNPDEKIIAALFISSDKKISYSIPCNIKTPFIKIEQKLYEEYPEYKDIKHHFIHNGNIIERFKTIEENNIKSGRPIILKMEK